MKILFVIATLDSGGAERVVTHLANFMSQAHEVAVATFWNEEPFYPLAKEVDYIRLDIMRQTRGFFQKARYFAKRVRSVRRLIKEQNPDIVISFLTETNIITTVAAKLAKKPVIISERIAHGFLQLRYLRIARRLVYPLADALVTQTQGDRQNYPYLRNVFVIPNPLALPHCPQTKREKIVLGVGRLEEQKGFADLIQAFVEAKLADWRLHIAGEGSQKDMLEKLIESLGATNVELIGRQKDIFTWYARASIFAMTSRYEGFPNALLEAMVCGCACVSYDCPYGPAELLGGERGILVPLGDTKALGEALGGLAKDAKLRKALGTKAQKYAIEEFAIEKIAKKWEEAMQHVLESSACVA